MTSIIPHNFVKGCEVVMKDLILALLEEKEPQNNFANNSPSNVHELTSIVMQMELAQEIDALRRMLAGNEPFDEQFKARCHWRSMDKDHCLSYSDFPDSPVHQLYLDLAKFLFKTSTDSELLSILSVDNNKVQEVTQQVNELSDAEGSKPLFPTLRAVEEEYLPSNPFVSPNNLTNTTEEQPLPLPYKHVKTAFQNITIQTVQELIQVLFNYPPEYYALLWANIALINAEKIMTQLASSIKQELFNQIQIDSLIKSIAKNYDRFQLSLPVMQWACMTNNSSIQWGIPRNIPKDKRLEVLCFRDHQGSGMADYINPDKNYPFIDFAFKLLPDEQKLDLFFDFINDEWGFFYTKTIDQMLKLIPTFELARRSRTFADIITKNRVNLGAKTVYGIMNILPSTERLEWIKSIAKVIFTHRFINVKVSINQEYLKKILLNFPENEQFNILRHPDVIQHIVEQHCKNEEEAIKVKISSTDRGFENSFIPNYLAIKSFIYQKQSTWHKKLFKSMGDNPYRFQEAFDKLETIEEVKQFIKEHIKRKPLSSLSKGLKQRLGPIVYENDSNEGKKIQSKDEANKPSQKYEKPDPSTNLKGKDEKEPMNKPKASPISLMESPNPALLDEPLQPTKEKKTNSKTALGFFPEAPNHEPEIQKETKVAVYS